MIIGACNKIDIYRFLCIAYLMITIAICKNRVEYVCVVWFVFQIIKRTLVICELQNKNIFNLYYGKKKVHRQTCLNIIPKKLSKQND